MTFIRWQPFTLCRRKERQLHYAGLTTAPGWTQRPFQLLLFIVYRRAEGAVCVCYAEWRGVGTLFRKSGKY